MFFYMAKSRTYVGDTYKVKKDLVGAVKKTNPPLK
jgi:hypothetical protein